MNDAPLVAAATPSALSAPARGTAAFAVLIAGTALPAILYLVLTPRDAPLTLPALARLTLLCAALPAALARGIARSNRAAIDADATSLQVRGARIALDVPIAAIAAIAPWALPLPTAGFSIHLRSGKRLPVSLACAELATVLEHLRDRGIGAAAAALHHPMVHHARARAPYRRRWWQRLGKFPVFALLPTAILFNAHQHIAYGGTFGQYYLVGPRAYFATLFGYWATVTIYLILYAGFWRGVAEVATFALAWATPQRCAALRRGAEIACAIAYYGGVPALLALRFAG